MVVFYLCKKPLIYGRGRRVDKMVELELEVFIGGEGIYIYKGAIDKNEELPDNFSLTF